VEKRTGRALREAALVVVIFAAAMLADACSQSTPAQPPVSKAVVHVVKPGETAYQIAHRYGVSIDRLLAANSLSDPRAIRVGQKLVIPSVHYASLGTQTPDFFDDRRFAWPVASGIVSSGFGVRNGTMHDGVDIAAPIGTSISAADAGVVIYSGKLRGYGNVVIIRHDSHYVTVYGHDSVNLVREGQQVARGQKIGEMGHSGHTTGPNLHFEVRRDNIARNPLPYLPAPDQTAGISFAANVGG